MATQGPIQLTQPVSERDHTRGPHSADVSLVEYGDFECPYCRAAEPIVAGLIEALGDRLSVTFRHFPLSQVHSHAGHAAEVAEAAAAQGKFWEMHDILFARQDALDDADLLKYAAELSLDSDRVSRELAGHEYARRVEEDQQSGLDSRVSGTPTFYIDGTRYDGSVALRDMLAAIRQLHPISSWTRPIWTQSPARSSELAQALVRPGPPVSRAPSGGRLHGCSPGGRQHEHRYS
jgi:protein-disulfide isomerase